MALGLAYLSDKKFDPEVWSEMFAKAEKLEDAIGGRTIAHLCDTTVYEDGQVGLVASDEFRKQADGLNG
jgi:hypothetical protein